MPASAVDTPKLDNVELRLERDVSYRTLDRPPLTFTVFRELIKWDVPGAWRLYRLLAEPRFKSMIAPFPLEDGSTIHVPLNWPGMLAGRGLKGYEPKAIAFFASSLGDAADPVTMIDCGADIGVFARLVLAKGVCISRLIAYEPNAIPFQVLQMNLGGLGVSIDLRNMAVSSTSGRKWLVINADEDWDHGAFSGAAQRDWPVGRDGDYRPVGVRS